MSGFTLRQLEIFAQVVEHGSFRKCADHLGVSQVSISEHVRELETRLGVKLFDRNLGGPATLTREGERAYRRVSSILADLNDLSWAMAGSRDARSRVKLAMHAYVMRHVREALAEFKGLYPEADVTVDLELAPAETLNQRVQQREVDVACFISFDGSEAPTSEMLRPEPLAIYVRRDHPLTRKPVVTAADLRATPLVTLLARNPMRIAVDRALEQAGYGGSPLALEVDEYGLILSTAQSSDGYVCMFRNLAEEAAVAGGLVTLPLEHPIPAVQIRMLARHSARHDPRRRNLIAAIERALRPT